MVILVLISVIAFFWFSISIPLAIVTWVDAKRHRQDYDKWAFHVLFTSIFGYLQWRRFKKYEMKPYEWKVADMLDGSDEWGLNP